MSRLDSMWRRHDQEQLVGVIDVGSNTVRLLVAHGSRPVLSLRELLRLGGDVEQFGRISAEKLERTADLVGSYAEAARARGVDQLEVLITSPGRQAANGEALLRRLQLAAGFPARILSAVDEGRLAFGGAVATARPSPRKVVAVVDVGGGSAQICVGTRRDGPSWVRSIDLGSQRLTSRLLSADPPGLEAMAAARVEVDAYLGDVSPPEIDKAFAVGGSARGLRRLVGARLGAAELADAAAILARMPTREVARTYGIDEGRVRTLAAGAVILAGVQERLGGKLEVVRGGLREGAVSELAARRRAA